MATASLSVGEKARSKKDSVEAAILDPEAGQVVTLSDASADPPPSGAAGLTPGAGAPEKPTMVPFMDMFK